MDTPKPPNKPTPNLHTRWSAAGIHLKDSNGPYAAQRLRQPRFFAAVQPEFRIARGDKLFAIGSCFARGIESALKNRGFQVESAAKDFDRFNTVAGQKVTALGFTNKYTTYSIFNELSWALDPDAKFPEASLVDLDEKRTIDPHINPTLQVVDRAGTLERRRIIQDVNSRLKGCRVLFMTLGLVEVWYDRHAEVHLNTTPIREMRELDPKRYEFMVSNYIQNMENLENLYALLKRFGHPELQIVVTTSPVPLNATFTGQDIVVANTYSKSTLRAVAQDFASAHANVQYFPSYEIVMNSQRELAWEDDLRHVRGAMTQHVMDQFMRGFVDGKETKESVTAVTVNYNGGPVLRGLIDSLEGQPELARVVVVDNASRDDSLSGIDQDKDGRLALIRNESNRGFAAACNQGAAHAEGRYLLFVNPDCRVPQGALRRMVDLLDERQDVGMVGPLVLNSDGSEQRGCRRHLPDPKSAFMRVLGRDKPDKEGKVAGFDLTGTPLPDRPAVVEAVSGACLLIRRELFDGLRGWDEGYFLHCEDLDLCMRVKRAGYKVLFVPDIAVTHAQGASSKRRPAFVHWHKHLGMLRYYLKFHARTSPLWLSALVIPAIAGRFLLLLPGAWLSRWRG
ncbi:MAG TPA: GSCFA domain-containing protein [Gammaproteobacteria bacterium]|nr:GSCFA domain-containing protein [Gammaproteobacteria bacterium]